MTFYHWYLQKINNESKRQNLNVSKNKISLYIINIKGTISCVKIIYSTSSQMFLSEVSPQPCRMNSSTLSLIVPPLGARWYCQAADFNQLLVRLSVTAQWWSAVTAQSDTENPQWNFEWNLFTFVLHWSCFIKWCSRKEWKIKALKFKLRAKRVKHSNNCNNLFVQ